MNGFDIRSFSENAIENMEKMYGVKIGEGEEKLYSDNCVLLDEEGSQIERCH